MAEFYGTVQGGRKQASRTGTRKSGLDAVAASYQGAVKTDLYFDGDVVYALVSLRKHCGHGVDRTIYEGPVGVGSTEVDRRTRIAGSTPESYARAWATPGRPWGKPFARFAEDGCEGLRERKAHTLFLRAIGDVILEIEADPSAYDVDDPANMRAFFTYIDDDRRKVEHAC